MRRIVTCGLPRSTIFFFSTLSHKWHDFRKKIIDHQICVFEFLQILCMKQLSFIRRNERDTIKMYIGLRVKCPLLLSDFKQTGIFRADFSKNTQMRNFITMCPVGGDLLLACGQTDIHEEANSRFSQFCEKRLKNQFLFQSQHSLSNFTEVLISP